MISDKYTPESEERHDALDAIRAAMESRQGGLVPDSPSGARAWGEADGYWITMHTEPVLDALMKIGWRPAEALVAPDRKKLAAVMVEHYYQARWRNEEASCTCRQWSEDATRKPYVTWSQHVADALIASDVLNGQKETLMAKSPEIMRIANEGMAKELIDTGKRLIEMGMALRDGMSVEVSYESMVSETLTRTTREQNK